MYRHLLVPVDAGDLSVEVVGSAVALARSEGARVSFFHALADDAPAAGGKARELLGKAEAAAHAYGVPCESFCTAGASRAEAIVAAARRHKCDLIVMPSLARPPGRGDAVTAETLSVLSRAGLPVLVTAAGDATPAPHAIRIIRDEHRSLAAVMHAWLHALAAARGAGAAPDVTLMRAMLRYVHRFPLDVHHPKEEALLFQRLRERTSALDAELDELQRQHAREPAWMATLAQHLDAVAAASGAEAVAAAAALEQSLDAYAGFLWEHMGREEMVVLPAAQRCLRADDWAHIDAAFRQNRDPDFRADDAHEYRRLFSKILHAAAAWH